jgi:murein DD-endopeptidase MepM/ murein hydrolase activator NlpD
VFAWPAAAAPLREAFDMAVVQPPGLVTVEGRRSLVFELHLTNFSAGPLAISRLRVLGDGGAVLRTFQGPELAGRVQLVGRSPDGASATLVPTGARAIVYVELDLDGPAPRALVQQVDLRTDTGETASVTGGRTVVTAPSFPALGAPLEGGPWVAIHHPDWARGHRRVVYAVDGRARLPGRFAIDWMKADDQGRIAQGDPDLAASALGYGVRVLAVADATVAMARDNVAESERVSRNPSHGLAEAAGNFVSLRLADGRYAIYEHLKPGSLQVKAGDQVRRGDPIAALGFTGDSTGPHLHFHVADGPVPVVGEGLPFAVEGSTLLGRYDDIGGLGTPWSALAAGVNPTRTREWPG